MPNFASNKRSANVTEDGEPRDEDQYLDNGATDHVSNDFNNLNISTEYKCTNQLAADNGSKLKIVSIGHTLLNILESYTLQYIKLNYILYVPKITKNLINISKLLHDNSDCIEFDKTSCVVKDKRRWIVLMKDVAKDKLYKLLACL